MYIDRGKVEKENNQISNLYFSDSIYNIPSNCNSTHIRTYNDNIQSKEINDFFSNSEIIIEPEIFKAMQIHPHCSLEKELIITADLNSSRDELTENQKIKHIVTKFFTLQAAFETANIKPRKIRVNIPFEKN
jgi:hypothetical protein